MTREEKINICRRLEKDFEKLVVCKKKYDPHNSETAVIIGWGIPENNCAVQYLVQYKDTYIEMVEERLVKEGIEYSFIS